MKTNLDCLCEERSKPPSKVIAKLDANRRDSLSRPLVGMAIYIDKNPDHYEPTTNDLPKTGHSKLRNIKRCLLRSIFRQIIEEA